MSGRPSDPLPQTTHAVTRRVRSLIARLHGGNLAAAQRLTGIPYPTLRELYRGTTVNPRLDTLRRLASTHGVAVDWFANLDDATVPRLPGRRALLPAWPDETGETPPPRPIWIPAVAEPMFALFGRLETWLDEQPPLAERPIVGSATGEALIADLTTFLFEPILAAEELGAEVVVTEREYLALSPDDSRREAWIALLRSLGTMWSVTLRAAPGFGRLAV